MTSINLLPWREELREKQKKLFFISLSASAAMAACLVLSVHLFFNKKIDWQNQRNAHIQLTIDKYDKEIREIRQLRKVRSALIARMNIIQQLQQNRPKLVHFFDELTKMLPKGVHLTQITRTGEHVLLQGVSDSNTGVSSLMRNIEANFWVSKASLEEIKEVTKKLRTIGKSGVKKLKFNEFRVDLLLETKKKQEQVF